MILLGNSAFLSCDMSTILLHVALKFLQKTERVYFVLDFVFTFLPLFLCVHCSNPGQINMLSLVCKELKMVNSVTILDYAICQPLF